MKIKMTGASGYLGSKISGELKKQGHDVFPISRNLLYGSTDALKEELNGAHALINLAGAPILQRWTKKNKKEIYDSRVETSRNLANALREMAPGNRPGKILAASAIGIFSPGKTHDEASTDFEKGFVGKVVYDWEASWNDLPDDLSVTVFRLPPVLGKEAQTIQKMFLPFKLGLGGKIGSGKQPFPFIHEKDVARAFRWALENEDVNGVFNLVAPQKITNQDFTRAFAKALNRPAFLAIPEFALKLLFGKAASMLTHSPQIESKRLPQAGFELNYSTIDEVMEEIFR